VATNVRYCVRQIAGCKGVRRDKGDGALECVVDKERRGRVQNSTLMAMLDLVRSVLPPVACMKDVMLAIVSRVQYCEIDVVILTFLNCSYLPYTLRHHPAWQPPNIHTFASAFPFRSTSHDTQTQTHVLYHSSSRDPTDTQFGDAWDMNEAQDTSSPRYRCPIDKLKLCATEVPYHISS
jgi:hypothetical protein